jgi:hypothetical protein
MVLKSCLTEFNTILKYWPRIGFGRNAFLSRSDVETLLSSCETVHPADFLSLHIFSTNLPKWLKLSSVVLTLTGRDDCLVTSYAELRTDGPSDMLWCRFGVEIT